MSVQSIAVFAAIQIYALNMFVVSPRPYVVFHFPHLICYGVHLFGADEVDELFRELGRRIASSDWKVTGNGVSAAKTECCQ